MDVLLIMLLGVGAIVVVVGAMVAGRKEEIPHSHRPSERDLPADRPVFLGHDERWTPAVTPEIAPTEPEKTETARETTSPR